VPYAPDREQEQELKNIVRILSHATLVDPASNGSRIAPLNALILPGIYVPLPNFKVVGLK
jgi:hypothetical protein